jgi:hypothetical protein
VAPLEGLSAALASIFEDRRAFIRVASPWLVIAVLITAYQVAGSWAAISHAPENIRLSLMLYALMGTLFTSGIALSLMLALFVGRIHSRKSGGHHRVQPRRFPEGRDGTLTPSSAYTQFFTGVFYVP